MSVTEHMKLAPRSAHNLFTYYERVIGRPGLTHVSYQGGKTSMFQRELVTLTFVGWESWRLRCRPATWLPKLPTGGGGGTRRHHCRLPSGAIRRSSGRAGGRAASSSRATVARRRPSHVLPAAGRSSEEAAAADLPDERHFGRAVCIVVARLAVFNLQSMRNCAYDSHATNDQLRLAMLSPQQHVFQPLLPPLLLLLLLLLLLMEMRLRQRWLAYTVRYRYRIALSSW